MPDGAVYVGRQSVWGNPYRVIHINKTTWQVAHHSHVLDEYVSRTGNEARHDAVERLRRLFEHDRDPWGKDRVRSELRGRDLACRCPDGAPCHADLLIEIANS